VRVCVEHAAARGCMGSIPRGPCARARVRATGFLLRSTRDCLARVSFAPGECKFLPPPLLRAPSRIFSEHGRDFANDTKPCKSTLRRDREGTARMPGAEQTSFSNVRVFLSNKLLLLLLGMEAFSGSNIYARFSNHVYLAIDRVYDL